MNFVLDLMTEPQIKFLPRWRTAGITRRRLSRGMSSSHSSFEKFGHNGS